MTIMQVKLRGDVFLRARISGDPGGEQAVELSIGPETADHAVRISEATAHALLVMLQLTGRGS
jgi:hypothetical protein